MHVMTTLWVHKTVKDCTSIKRNLSFLGCWFRVTCRYFLYKIGQEGWAVVGTWLTHIVALTSADDPLSDLLSHKFGIYEHWIEAQRRLITWRQTRQAKEAVQDSQREENRDRQRERLTERKRQRMCVCACETERAEIDREILSER